LAGGAGEDGDRSDPAAPAAREPEQAPAEQRGGEVLLRDRHLAALPSIAELVQIRNDHVAQERVDREAREQRVEDGVGVAVVEACERGGKLVLRGGGGDVFVRGSCRL